MKGLRVGIFLAVFSLTGCLTTVQEMRDRDARPAVSAAQERQANMAVKAEETDTQMRALNGRIEVLENEIAQLKESRQAQQEKAAKENESRMRAYEETVTRLEAAVRSLEQELNAMAAAKATAAAAKPAAKGKEAFQSAEASYTNKEYKQAIVDYEAYRKANPKGKHYAQATLKIGLSFHELGMKDEAKSFFEEVVANFPSSAEAKKASQRLKSMK